MKARLALSAAVASVALALTAAGCGAGGEGSGADPAGLVPPRSPLFIAATVRPEGELKENVEALARRLAGVGDLGNLIVSELESTASDSGEDFDFEKEVSPWLGEQGGVFLAEFDGEDFHRYGFAIPTTDTGATQDFIDEQSDDSAEAGSYGGVGYEIDTDDGSTVGVIDDFLAVAEDERTFKSMVDAAAGESLAREDRYAETVAAAPEGSFADVYVDFGKVIGRPGATIDPDAKLFLDSAGIDPAGATAVASLIPGSGQIEIQLRSRLGRENPSGGDASELLAALPADSVAAVAVANFGARVEEAIDRIDTTGIPGEVPPGKLKSTLERAGIDLGEVAASIGDAGVFVEGGGESDLAGAAVFPTKDAKEARSTVSTVGLLMRAGGTAGVTPIPGGLSGFSVRNDEFGPKPLVIAARGARIAIAYGLAAATRALASGAGGSLSGDPAYRRAVAALRGTPISGFADGPAALRLASSLIAGSDDEEGFEGAKPYLAQIEYLAIGSVSSGELATARLIAGIGK